ncbi:MAG: DinB family protein, partial [Pseudomonadota bacterium]
MKAHFEMMAAYNAWANGRLYQAVEKLDDDDYRRDLGAFFRSLHGTLNHLYVADIIWMARFRGQPIPAWDLDYEPHHRLDDLKARRSA